MLFVRIIPPEFEEAYKLGKLVLRGCLLKDSQTGFIIGHLRETQGLLNLVSSIPVNPIQMVTGLVESASSLVANYQLYKMDGKIDNLTTEVRQGLELLNKQMTGLEGLTQITMGVSAFGAVASVATFALCLTQLKAVSNRLTKLEERTNEVLEKLEHLKKDNDKREIRNTLSDIRGNLDYLSSPSTYGNKSKIDSIQLDLGKGFSRLNNYLSHKIEDDGIQLDFESVNFLYDVMIMTAMSEFKAHIILNDASGALHILNQRKDYLLSLNKNFLSITQKLRTNKLEKFENIEKLKSFALNARASCLEIHSQEIIVSEFILKKQIPLKRYYENLELGNNGGLIQFIRH